MLRLSKKLLFAIEAVVDIAYNGSLAPVRSSDISERQGIPRRYLEQVLQQLVRAGILAGQRGPKGGYRLARERRRISLGEIIRVVRATEGAENPLDAMEGSDLGQKVVRPLWQEVESEMMGRFDEITIEDLCGRARKAKIDREAPTVADFSI
jgi:Rrf2 family protein